ncbi:MAG: hypothetical protein ACSHX8_05760 [Opitutaceae bacterium]
MYFNQPADAPDSVLMYQVGTEPIEVALPGYNFTPCYDIPAGEQILRFLLEPLAVGEEFPQGAPFVRVPEKWQKVLVLAFHDPQNPTLPVKFRAINASPSKFDNGNTMFINFSPKVIFGMLGDKKLIVQPGKVVVKKDSYPLDEDYFVSLRQMNPDKTENYRFLTKMFRHYPDQRKMVFIYVPEGSKSVRYFVTTIREYYAEGEGG